MANNPPEWDVVYYSDVNIVITHKADNGYHAMVPPQWQKAQHMWSPQSSVHWINEYWSYGGRKYGVTCYCGSSIPVPILERFISTVNLIGRK